MDIAKALERPPEYVLKWYGCELGAQTKFDKKTGSSIVNGAHDTGKLTELLESFIKKYVQCYACGNPETVIKIKKENIYLKCKACGFVSEVDPRLRLNTFIVKNPPENKLSKAEQKVKKAEKERLKALEEDADKGDKKTSRKKSTKKKGTEEGSGEAQEVSAEISATDSNEEDEVEDDKVVWATDISEEAMRRRAEEQLSQATAAMVTQGNIEAEREAALRREAKRLEDEAKAAQEAQLAAELDKKAALEAAGGDEEVARVRSAARDPGATPASVQAVLAKVEGAATQRMRVLYHALFADVGESEKIASKFAQCVPILAPHAKDKAGELAQLMALEHLLAVGIPDRSREVALILKVLYDEDIASEELILAWAAKPHVVAVLGVPEEASKSVRDFAKPFVEWLENEDEDSSEED